MCNLCNDKCIPAWEDKGNGVRRKCTVHYKDVTKAPLEQRMGPRHKHYEEIMGVFLLIVPALHMGKEK
jgi:hypothetical protein